MANKEYKMGVIGLGMGINMLPVNNRTDIPIKVTQISGVPAQKAMMADLEAKYGLDRCTDNFMEMIEDKDLDIIGVFSPDPLHYEHCKAALEAGKHVVCTKPLVANLDHAKELCSLVRKTGLKFMVGQTMRYEAQFAAIRKMYDDGELGDVFMGEAHYVHDMRPLLEATPWRGEMPQDLIYGGLAHPMDAMRWFFGDVEEVHALGNKSGFIKGVITGKEYPWQDNYMVNVKFKNGVIARCLGLYGLVHPPMPMMGINLYGTKGSAVAEFSDFEGGKVKATFDKYEIKSPFESIYPPETEGAFGHGRTALRYMKHFGECLVNDTEPQPSIFEGAKTVAACAAAFESMNTGEIVKVFNEF
ncbi:MAG: Gfo/Idh/MocA family oxidoreductase [Clostridiales bacterium]|nr:Gfo/Idh/MocA family oxidoreductase [Clostridiales bacterium]